MTNASLGHGRVGHVFLSGLSLATAQRSDLSCSARLTMSSSTVRITKIFPSFGSLTSLFTRTEHSSGSVGSIDSPITRMIRHASACSPSRRSQRNGNFAPSAAAAGLLHRSRPDAGTDRRAARVVRSARNLLFGRHGPGRSAEGVLAAAAEDPVVPASAVADAARGEDLDRLGGVVAELAAQAPEERAHRLRLRFRPSNVAVPDTASLTLTDEQQSVVGAYATPAFGAGERAQQVHDVLGGGQVHVHGRESVELSAACRHPCAVAGEQGRTPDCRVGVQPVGGHAWRGVRTLGRQ